MSRAASSILRNARRNADYAAKRYAEAVRSGKVGAAMLWQVRLEERRIALGHITRAIAVASR